eukprot:scaffold5546_cov202-Prasinococcus_capsulatus_cf.AAC.1
MQAALINAAYAATHGYSFAYVQLQTHQHPPVVKADSGTHSCHHVTNQWPRAASYCKLLVVAGALAAGFEVVVEIDRYARGVCRNHRRPAVHSHRPPC